MSIALASLIEGNWRIFILLLFVIGFNPYNIYTIFYYAPMHGDISICTYLGYWVGAYVWPLICVFLFVTHQYFIPYSIFLRLAIFIFKLILFLLFFLTSTNIFPVGYEWVVQYHVTSKKQMAWRGLQRSIVRALCHKSCRF